MDSNPPPEPVWSTAQLAEHLGCKAPQIYKLVAAGRIRGFLIGKELRFGFAEVRDFIERETLSRRPAHTQSTRNETDRTRARRAASVDPNKGRAFQ